MKLPGLRKQRIYKPGERVYVPIGYDFKEEEAVIVETRIGETVFFEKDGQKRLHHYAVPAFNGLIKTKNVFKSLKEAHACAREEKARDDELRKNSPFPNTREGAMKFMGKVSEIIEQTAEKSGLNIKVRPMGIDQEGVFTK